MPGTSDIAAASPVGTTELFPYVPIVVLDFKSIIVVFASFVPTGLLPNLMPNPGTEVPGYFHGVPTGRRVGLRFST